MGVEVGDHADGVRQVHAVLERGAALVVDEDERHRVRTVGHRERGDQRLEEFGLAGAGSAGDQPVRAVAPQVQVERAVQGDADGRPGRAASGRPACLDVGGPRWVEGEDVEQPRGSGEHRGLLVGPARIPQRAHRPGQRTAPVQGHQVGPDTPDGALSGASYPDGSAGLLGDDGVALLGQQALLGVQTDRADADGRTVAQDLRHAGQRTQPAGPVEDDEHVGPGGPTPPVLPAGALGDQRGQFRDPPGAGLRAVADAGRGVTGLLAHMRQPTQPGPALPALFAGRQQVDLEVTGAVQDGGLSDDPARHGPRGRALAGDAQNVVLPQRNGHRDVVRGPPVLAAVFVLRRVLEHHVGGHVRSSDAQFEEVGVGGTAFPQAAPGPDGGQHDLGRVRETAAPRGAFGRQGLRRVALDARLLLLIGGDAAGVGLAPGAPAHQVVAEDRDRGEQPEQQHRHTAEHQRPGPRHHQRDRSGDPRERPGGRRGGRGGQGEAGGVLGRPQPRRPIVVPPGAVLRRLHGRVRLLREGELEQAAADEELRADRPGSRLGEVLTVQLQGAAVRRGGVGRDTAASLGAHRQDSERTGRYGAQHLGGPVVGQPDPVLAHVEAVYGARAGPADRTDPPPARPVRPTRCPPGGPVARRPRAGAGRPAAAYRRAADGRRRTGRGPPGAGGRLPPRPAPPRQRSRACRGRRRGGRRTRHRPPRPRSTSTTRNVLQPA